MHKRLRPWNTSPPLRDWQERARRRFYALNQANFLVVSTPGSGKTLLALRLAHDLLSDRVVERVVVVAPTNHLKAQWAAAAAHVGLDLDPQWSNADGVEAPDYHGVVVTYQQVSFAPDLYRFNCSRRATLVIFDEIHHAGTTRDWGIKLRTAFAGAQVRLSLSGTPFRSDEQPLPFVTYREGECQPDFVYSYGAALAEDVCRPIYFYTRKGRVAWVRGNGREVTHEMLDHLPRQEAAERLRAVLDPSGNWLRDVLREADGELSQKRAEGHPDAAGLVIAIDQLHARRIVALLKKITGETAAIAISDEPEASNTIKAFAAAGNPARWIVAVKMISEGVDIPRLRVGVYATTTGSALFFRQAVGRFVRVIPALGEQSAVLFLPAVGHLMEHALAIKEEREHYLQSATGARGRRQERIENAGAETVGAENIGEHGSGGANTGVNTAHVNTIGGENEGDQSLTPVSVDTDDDFDRADDAPLPATGWSDSGGNSGGGGRANGFPTIVPLYSEALPHTTIFNGMQFTPGEIEHAKDFGREYGVRLPAAQLAALLKHSFERLRGEHSTGALLLGTAAAATATTAAVVLPGAVVLSDARAAELPPRTTQHFAADHTADTDQPFAAAPLITKTERKRRVREQINRHANRLARRLGVEERAVHHRWLVEMNGSRQSEATEDELWRKLRWLTEQNERAGQSRERASHAGDDNLRTRAGNK